jgi:histidyl-tRNA synthetase
MKIKRIILWVKCYFHSRNLRNYIWNLKIIYNYDYYKGTADLFIREDYYE